MAAICVNLRPDSSVQNLLQNVSLYVETDSWRGVRNVMTETENQGTDVAQSAKLRKVGHAVDWFQYVRPDVEMESK